MDPPGNPQHALITPLSTNLQLQPNAFAQEMSTTTPNGWVIKPPNSMHQDCVMPGLEDHVPHSFGASHPYNLPNPAAHAGTVMPSFPFPTGSGVHHLDNFKDGGGYMMQSPQLAATSGFQPVMIDGFYQMQQHQATMKGTANGRESAPTRKTQRMIKNRESAARSRARRQAYTTQLETQIQNLKEENNLLKENLKLLEEDTLILPKEEKKPRLRTSASAEF